MSPTVISPSPPSPANSDALGMTMRVLRRYIPDLSHIVESASFAHLYFGHGTDDCFERWDRSLVEGPFFLVATTSGANVICILNRQGMTNFFWTLESTDGLEIDVTSSSIHVIMTPRTGHHYLTNEPDDCICYGFWIYEKENDSTWGEPARMSNAIWAAAATPPPPNPIPGRSIMDQVFPGLGNGNGNSGSVVQAEEEFETNGPGPRSGRAQMDKFRLVNQGMDMEQQTTSVLDMLYKSAAAQGHITH